MTDRDWTFVIAIGGGILGIALITTIDVATHLPADIVDQHKPIARAGEWVTHPDGRKVCRLPADLYWNQIMEAKDCTDWQEPVPFRGQMVDWLGGPILSHGNKINIGGEWRP